MNTKHPNTFFFSKNTCTLLLSTYTRAPGARTKKKNRQTNFLNHHVQSCPALGHLVARLVTRPDRVHGLRRSNFSHSGCRRHDRLGEERRHLPQTAETSHGTSQGEVVCQRPPPAWSDALQEAHPRPSPQGTSLARVDRGQEANGRA